MPSADAGETALRGVSRRSGRCVERRCRVVRTWRVGIGSGRTKARRMLLRMGRELSPDVPGSRKAGIRSNGRHRGAAAGRARDVRVHPRPRYLRWAEGLRRFADAQRPLFRVAARAVEWRECVEWAPSRRSGSGRVSRGRRAAMGARPAAVRRSIGGRSGPVGVLPRAPRRRRGPAVGSIRAMARSGSATAGEKRIERRTSAGFVQHRGRSIGSEHGTAQRDAHRRRMPGPEPAYGATGTVGLRPDLARPRKRCGGAASARPRSVRAEHRRVFETRCGERTLRTEWRRRTGPGPFARVLGEGSGGCASATGRRRTESRRGAVGSRNTGVQRQGPEPGARVREPGARVRTRDVPRPCRLLRRMAPAPALWCGGPGNAGLRSSGPFGRRRGSGAAAVRSSRSGGARCRTVGSGRAPGGWVRRRRLGKTHQPALRARRSSTTRRSRASQASSSSCAARASSQSTSRKRKRVPIGI